MNRNSEAVSATAVAAPAVTGKPGKGKGKAPAPAIPPTGKDQSLPAGKGGTPGKAVTAEKAADGKPATAGRSTVDAKAGKTAKIPDKKVDKPVSPAKPTAKTKAKPMKKGK